MNTFAFEDNFATLMLQIEEMNPSRERSIALTKLEEAYLWLTVVKTDLTSLEYIRDQVEERRHSAQKK